MKNFMNAPKNQKYVKKDIYLRKKILNSLVFC